MVSFLLCDIARDLGAVVVTGVPVARIIPGEGVELEGGERIEARSVISNADPRRRSSCWAMRPTPPGKRGSRQIPQVGCTVKLNVVLKELPSFKARPGTFRDHHKGQINTPLTKEEWASSFRPRAPASCPRGSGRSSTSTRPTTPSVAPAGVHTMSVFAQYVPHTFARGDWDTPPRRGEGRWHPARSGGSATTCRTPFGRRPGAGTARYRGESGADRRSYLPGRMPSRLHVGQAADAANADARASSSAAPAPTRAAA